MLKKTKTQPNATQAATLRRCLPCPFADSPDFATFNIVRRMATDASSWDPAAAAEKMERLKMEQGK